MLPELRIKDNFIDLPTLYKENKNGSIQKWKTYLILYNTKHSDPKPLPIKQEYLKPLAKLPDEYASIIFTVWGIKDGKQQTAELNITKGLNIGKANETNVLTQAISEMSGTWTAKRDRKGYSIKNNIIVNNSSTKNIRPVLLHKYHEQSHKINFENAWLQEKLDGVRCLANYDPKTKQVNLISRTNTVFNNLDHIRAALLKIPLFVSNPNLYLDGELYSRKLDFEQITSVVRQKTMKPELKVLERSVSLNVFDLYDSSKPSMPFTKRIELVYKILPKSCASGICSVPSYRVTSDAQVQKMYKEYLAKGGEGAVIRNGDAPYQINFRSYDILKLKDINTEEFKIVGFTDGKGKDKGQIIFILTTPEGNEFKAPPKNTNTQLRKEMFNDGEQFIGKDATVEFMGYTTKNNVPRFPKVLVIRDYE